MTGDAQLVALGQEALAGGDWSRALECYEADAGRSAAVLEGLATARCWLGDIDGSFADWEEAYVARLDGDDTIAAFAIAVRLSLLSQANRGNRAQALGWAGLHERYVREWLAGMVTGGVADYDPETRRYALTIAQAALLTSASESR